MSEIYEPRVCPIPPPTYGVRKWWLIVPTTGPSQLWLSPKRTPHACGRLMRQPLSREAVCSPVVLTIVLVSLGQHNPFQWGSAVLGAGVAWKRLASHPSIRSPEQREEKPVLWLRYGWLQEHDTVPSIFTSGPGIQTQALMLCRQGCLRISTSSASNFQTSGITGIQHTWLNF